MHFFMKKSRVPDKTNQSKIWANEYINLGTLLSSFPGDPKYNFTVKSSGSNQPVVSVEPVQNSKSITSIDQWTIAFQVFVAVYTIRFPDSASGLMKYSVTLRDLAAKTLIGVIIMKIFAIYVKHLFSLGTKCTGNCGWRRTT